MRLGWGMLVCAALVVGCGDEAPGGGVADAGSRADVGLELDAGAGADAGADAGAGQDGGPADAASADGGPADATSGDSGPGDATPADGGPRDATPVDGGPGDATPADGGPTDGAPGDGGAGDAAPTDGGPTDGAVADAGVDAGPVDGGTLALTPTSTVVPMGASARLAVNAPAGAPVVWAADSVVGGGSQVGTIVPDADPRGAVYTAPLAPRMPPPGQVTVTAAAAGEVATAVVDLAYVAPTVAAIAPAAFDVDQPTTTATISGAGFTPQTAVYFGGIRQTLTSARWDRLTFDVPTTLLIFPGPREVRVENPAPGGGADSVTVQVILRRTEIGAGLPANIAGLFAGAPVGTDANRQPSLTYPADTARAPRDFPSPEIAFAAAGADDVCQVSVAGPGVALEYYASTQGWPAEENPHVQVAPADWGRILTSNPGISLVLEVTCGRLNGAGTQLVGDVHVSAPVAYTVEPQAAGGRIVYFSGLIEGLWRIELGSFTPQGVPWIGPSPAFQFQTNGCVGCHSLAPSGTRMSYTSGQSEFGIFDTTSGNPSPLTGLLAADGAEWSAVHPSGQWVVGVDLLGRLVLYGAATGATVQVVPTPANRTFATQPFWSPSGDRLAFVASNTLGGGVHDVVNGEIWSIPFTATATPAFGTATRLVPRAGAGNDFYPAFSPDGQWLVFCRAPNGASFNNPGSQLMLTNATGTVGPRALDRANTARPNNFNSWPRWAPTQQGGRYWIVFSSQRPYPPLNGTGPQQLWVTGIDTARLPADPSQPAIWLPGQAPFTGNLTAEWSASQ